MLLPGRCACHSPSRPRPTRAAADALSQAAVEVQAQDLALEDALYALDKALNSGAVEADAYLKQARLYVAHRQAVHVATRAVPLHTSAWAAAA